MRAFRIYGIYGEVIPVYSVNDRHCERRPKIGNKSELYLKMIQVSPVFVYRR